MLCAEAKGARFGTPIVTALSSPLFKLNMAILMRFEIDLSYFKTCEFMTTTLDVNNN
jgi:hypothetical protein